MTLDTPGNDNSVSLTQSVATRATTAVACYQCLMQRPVHPSYGREKQNVDGCLFAWTGGGRAKKIYSYASWSPIRRTAQSALHIMLLSYYIGIRVFHERQCDICRRHTYSEGCAKAVHMSYDRQHFDTA